MPPLPLLKKLVMLLKLTSRFNLSSELDIFILLAVCLILTHSTLF